MLDSNSRIQRYGLPDYLIQLNDFSTRQIFSIVKRKIKFADCFIKIAIPQKDYIISDNFKFNVSNTYLPKPSNQSSNRLKLPFYSKTFHIVYFLIGKTSQGIWDQFMKAYEQKIPQQHRPIKNMGSFEDLPNLRANLSSLIESGLKLKVIIEDLTPHLSVKPIEDILNKKAVSEVLMEGDASHFQKWKAKYRIKKSIREQFSRRIEDVIRGSLHLKQGIYYNFVNLESRSEEVFKKKKVIQECIKSKELAQYIENHGKFSEMLRQYKNVACLKKIEKVVSESSWDFELVQKINAHIRMIQQQEQQFCQWLGKQLSHCLQVDRPIQELQNQRRERIFFRIVDEYKQEHSIYEIINNSIRFSLSINENNVNCLATFIKYLYQAVQHFYLKQRSKFPHCKVYRGTIISDQQYDSLQEGSIFMNLAFMSTSSSESTAKGFLPRESNSALFITIQLGDQFRDCQEYLEGFFELAPQYRNQGVEQIKYKNDKKISTDEQQVLFNPLNIFRVVSKQQKKNELGRIKYLNLQYAPHLTLFKKIRNRTITTQERELYDSIRANICSLLKNNDKGRALHLRGQVAKALDHYQRAQKNGESLTISQKFRIVEIYKERKNYEKVEKLLGQAIAEFEQKYQGVKDNQKRLSQIDRVSRVVNLNKQSEYLNLTQNFYEAEKKAKKAYEQSQSLKETVEDSNSSQTAKLTYRKVLEYYTVNNSSLNQLAKVRDEKNDNELSICDCFVGFLQIDLIYRIYEGVVFRRYKKELDKVFLQWENSEQGNSLGTLRKIWSMKLESLSQQEQSRILKANIEEFKAKRREFEMFGKELIKNSQKSKRIAKKYQYISEYFLNRKSPSELFQLFLQALSQLQRILVENQQVKKEAVHMLIQYKSNIDELRKRQKQFYSIMKSNLRTINEDIRPCLMSQKKNYYNLQKQEHLERYYQRFVTQVERQKLLNTERISYHNLFCSFLLECSDIEQRQEQSRRLKQYGRRISEKLYEKVNQQCRQNKDINLTNEMTQIILTQVQECKNNLLDSNVIERAVAIRKSNQIRQSKRDVKQFKTVAGFKRLEDFKKLLAKFEELERTHESDNYIDKTYYLLNDLITEVQILNNSEAVAETRAEHHQYLLQASEKIERFKENYLSLSTKMNEKLAQFYYQQAHNKLKRGYFKQAEKLISKTKRKLHQLYQNQDQTSKFNKLIARDVPVKICRLEAEIIGVYGDNRYRKAVLNELVQSMKFIEQNAPQKFQALAIIHEAVAFLAIRSLPKIIKFSKKNFKKAKHSLNESIKLRTGLLGEHNQFLAVAYTHLILMRAKVIKEERDQTFLTQVKEQYEKATEIFLSLDCDIDQNIRESHLDREPTLYLCKMLVEANYKLGIEGEGQEDMVKVAHCYKTNIESFTKKNKGLKSLQIVESILRASQHLCKQKGFQRQCEKYLKICEKQVNSLILFNNHVNNGHKTSIAIIESQKAKVLYNLHLLYKQNGNLQKSEQYYELLKQFDLKIRNFPRIYNPQQNQKQGIVLKLFNNFLQCFGVYNANYD